MGSEPPGQSPPQEADTHYWRSGDQYTGLALRQLAVGAVRSLSQASGKRGAKGVFTGSWAIIDWNCGGLTTPESRRYSSSVRMVERDRLMPALSPMVARVG